MNQPFNHNYFIGYVNQIFPDFVRVHFPSSVLLNKFIYSGEEFNAGLVGNYVTIEGENFGFLGKILEVSLPEKERLELNEKAFRNREFHPTGKIEVLLCFDYFNPDKVSKGISAYPNIGSKVFVCPSNFIQKYFKGFGVKEANSLTPTLDLGSLSIDSKTKIEVSQQALFGRHCAIVGTTGGGKSWTVSKCLEEVIKNNSKAILIDATGEYSTFDGMPKVAQAANISDNFFHYSYLTVEDIFILLKPGGQVQAPKLLEAIKSLKILKLLEQHADGTEVIKYQDGSFSVNVDGNHEPIKVVNGAIKKENELQRPFNRFYKRFMELIDTTEADFNIGSLPLQIQYECVQEFNWNDATKWGGRQDNHLNNCVSLILRATSLIQNSQFGKIFGIKKQKDDEKELTKVIDRFIDSKDSLLRISFEEVGFDFQSREILANAIGKYLLLKARDGIFKTQPTILFIDEAHQYLNKHIRDEYFEAVTLNAFDQIAKECRKYGLFLCLATQMPRDIPLGTLSQVGTFIVHRLINTYDREVIESACSSANKNTLSFLPVLGEGEGILMGVDFPMPVVLKINKPTFEPNSKTPLFTNIQPEPPTVKAQLVPGLTIS